MKDRLTAERAILILLKLTADILAVLVRRVIFALAFSTLQGDDFHGSLFLACHIYAP